MSKYTTEVRFICENYAGLQESKGYDNVREIIEQARSKIFDFDYPIFDEDYRPVLETKILMHYYTREICEETVGLWKLRLMSRMNDIMPLYNKLYESELIKFDPMRDADYTKDGNRNVNESNRRDNDLTRTSRDGGSEVSTGKSVGSGSDTRNTDSSTGGEDVTSTSQRDKYSQWDLYSDTPQGGIEGILGAEDEASLVDNGYLTNARHILHDGDGTEGSSTTEYGGTRETDETINYGKIEDRTGRTDFGRTNVTDDTGNTTFAGNTLDEYTEHVFGKMPGMSPSKMLKEFRETFLNIDLDIIQELRNLFFNLW